MYFTSPSRTAIRERRRSTVPPKNERIIPMIGDIVNGFISFFSGLIDSGSTIANGALDAGSLGAGQAYQTVTGSVSGIFN